jgi:hypothetical protein
MSSQPRDRFNATHLLPSTDRRSSIRLVLGFGAVAGLLGLGACGVDNPPDPGAGGTGALAGSNAAQAGSSVAGNNTSAGGSSASGSTNGGGSSVAGAAGTGGASNSGGTGTSSAGSAGSSGSGGGLGVGGGGSGSGGGSSGPGCAGKTYKLCEDFESGASGALPTNWTKFKGYGAGAATDVGLATDQFHGGKSSLKSSSMATGQTRAQTSLAALGATASKHWGRIFYKVGSPEASKPTSGVLHVTFVGLMGTGENRVVDTVEDSKGTHQWLYNNPDDTGSKGSAYDWTFDAAWHCAEWYVDVGAKAYRFFSDSKEVTSIGFTGKDDAQMSSYQSIIVGAEFYQMPPAPFVVWFDDLAIDDNQIGCQ